MARNCEDRGAGDRLCGLRLKNMRMLGSSREVGELRLEAVGYEEIKATRGNFGETSILIMSTHHLREQGSSKWGSLHLLHEREVCSVTRTVCKKKNSDPSSLAQYSPSVLDK